MKKKTPSNKRRKLSLTKSVIRTLDNLDLREVVGGNFFTDWKQCGG